jgi:hypothetical protein
MVVYDRVSAPDGSVYRSRTHFAVRPEQVTPRLYRARAGRGAIVLAVVRGGESSVAPDSDLKDGPSDAFRVEVAPDGRPGRFLTVLRVALGDPPELDASAVVSDDAIDGVAFDDSVVIFSAGPLGPPLALGIRYQVAGPPRRRTHWIVGARGTFDARIAEVAGGSEVHLVAGSTYSADGSGIAKVVV